MTLTNERNERGSISITFNVDHHRLETWFTVTLAIYSTDTEKGRYKEYQFSTYKAAHNKAEFLAHKHGFRNY